MHLHGALPSTPCAISSPRLVCTARSVTLVVLGHVTSAATIATIIVSWFCIAHEDRFMTTLLAPVLAGSALTPLMARMFDEDRQLHGWIMVLLTQLLLLLAVTSGS